MYVDVESMLVGWLQARLPVARVVTEVPASLGTLGGPPIIQLTRIAGAGRVLSLDDAVVDVDCYALTDSGAASRQAARALAYQTMAMLQSELPGYTSNGASVTRVVVDNGPTWRPYDDTNVRRYGVSVTVTVHSPNAATV